MTKHVNVVDAAYEAFGEATRHIWEGQDRKLTTEECEEYAQKVADQYGLDWKWDDDEGMMFSAKAH